MKSRGIILLLGLLALLYVGKRLSELGAFYQSKRPFPQDSLDYIASIPGPEDMEIDPYRKGIWVSSGLHCASSQDSLKGSDIYFLDFSSGQPKPLPMEIEVPEDFNPHGISLWADSLGRHRLFAVNHRSNGSQSIEIFQIRDEAQGPTLEHDQSLSSKALTWPNDVLAIGPSRALVTVVSKYGKAWGKQMDAFLDLHGGFVMYLDSARSYTVAGGLAFPNGILRGKQAKEIYVAETIGGAIRSFTLQEDGHLLALRRQFIHYGLDNLAWGAEGKLWAAAQSNMLALAGHIQNPEKTSPSAIFRIDPQTVPWKVDMLYQDPGKKQAGISVALSYQSKLYLGAFCQSQILSIPYQP